MKRTEDKAISLFPAIALLAGLFIQNSSAVVITPGLTYAAATDSNTDFATHFHSNSAGAFGTPASKAEVGGFSTTTGIEEVRGFSEFDLAGLSAGPAFISFDVFSAGGLFVGVNDFPFDGTIDIFSYQGNNTEDLIDFEVTATMPVDSFPTAALSVGDSFSFNITSQLDNALTSGWTSLGIRLQTNGGRPANGGAFAFDNFQLTSSDDSTGTNVPDTGATLALFSIALVGLLGLKRTASA
ncbi:VPDSG-CTERM sorting domain-containing protein [Verrucomicrobiales bacterium]|nr:VPDSG-CTERM sorting domain-containing protein [Verrucomicrobiales bacterium]